MKLLFYKCRWCGKVFEVDASLVLPGPWVIHQQREHICDLTRTGLADLIGIKEGE